MQVWDLIAVWIPEFFVLNINMQVKCVVYSRMDGVTVQQA